MTTKTRNKPLVFVSHARTDKIETPLLKKIVDRLIEEDTFSIWLDNPRALGYTEPETDKHFFRLSADAKWLPQIEQALRDAHCILACFSEAFCKRYHGDRDERGIIRKEVNAATHDQKGIYCRINEFDNEKVPEEVADSQQFFVYEDESLIGDLITAIHKKIGQVRFGQVEAENGKFRSRTNAQLTTEQVENLTCLLGHEVNIADIVESDRSTAAITCRKRDVPGSLFDRLRKVDLPASLYTARTSSVLELREEIINGSDDAPISWMGCRANYKLSDDDDEDSITGKLLRAFKSSCNFTEELPSQPKSDQFKQMLRQIEEVYPYSVLFYLTVSAEDRFAKTVIRILSNCLSGVDRKKVRALVMVREPEPIKKRSTFWKWGSGTKWRDVLSLPDAKFCKHHLSEIERPDLEVWEVVAAPIVGVPKFDLTNMVDGIYSQNNTQQLDMVSLSSVISKEIFQLSNS